jgi:hypothetical protein
MPFEMIDLRGADKVHERRIPRAEAQAMARAGLIEGICNKMDSPLKYVRRLSVVASEQATEGALLPPREPESHSTAFCRPNMGVVREPVNQAIVALDRNDKRVVVGEGEQIGYCYALVAQPPSNWEAQMSVVQRS